VPREFSWFQGALRIVEHVAGSLVLLQYEWEERCGDETTMVHLKNEHPGCFLFGSSCSGFVLFWFIWPWAERSWEMAPRKLSSCHPLLVTSLQQRRTVGIE
jgi:hypothetical protein